MREVIEEIVEVLKRHDINVEMDSAQIEICGAEIVFRCRDLSKMDWQAKRFQDMLDSMRIFEYRREIYGSEDKV